MPEDAIQGAPFLLVTDLYDVRGWKTLKINKPAIFWWQECGQFCSMPVPPETEEISSPSYPWDIKVSSKYKQERVHDSWIQCNLIHYFQRKQLLHSSKQKYLTKCPQRSSDEARDSFVISGSGPLGLNKIEGCVMLIIFFCTFRSP